MQVGFARADWEPCQRERQISAIRREKKEGAAAVSKVCHRGWFVAKARKCTLLTERFRSDAIPERSAVHDFSQRMHDCLISIFSAVGQNLPQHRAHAARASPDGQTACECESAREQHRKMRREVGKTDLPPAQGWRLRSKALVRHVKVAFRTARAGCAARFVKRTSEVENPFQRPMKMRAARRCFFFFRCGANLPGCAGATERLAHWQAPCSLRRR